MQSNSDTNILLVLILAVLLFGSGAVLGFFSTVFWIIVAISIIILLIVAVFWFIGKAPEIAAETIEEQKVAYKKHPIGIVLLLIFLTILFGFFSNAGSISVILSIALIIGLTVWLVMVMARESKKAKFKSEEDKVYEETHPGWERKSFFGSKIETNKVDYGNWKATILIIISLFILMFVIGAISSRF